MIGKKGSIDRPQNYKKAVIYEGRANLALCVKAASGYYLDTNNNINKCKYNCECVQYEYCTACLGVDGAYREVPYCSCKLGYYADS